MADPGKLVLLGRFSSVYGVKGWIKVRSDTDPLEAIRDYPLWQVCCNGQWTEWSPAQVRRHGKGLVVCFEGVSDRDAAARFVGAEIAVFRHDMPELPEDEYYWCDLLGLQVVTAEGVELGTVESLFATGANDVMVVAGDRQRLIPWVRPDVVMAVDMTQGTVQVNWDPDF